MSDATVWIAAIRDSHQRLAAALTPLTGEQVRAQSYDDDWSIAQVASHLGSQAQIFDLGLTAGLTGAPAPEMPEFREIWASWDATEPAEQVQRSLAVDEALVTRFEGLTAAEQGTFRVTLFGSDLDLVGLLGMRLGEHALHTWDIAVALDPAATLAPSAVELLVDAMPQRAGSLGRPAGSGEPVAIRTEAPERHFTLTTSPEVTLTVQDEGSDAPLTLPAESLIRLLYGRLDPDHTPTSITGPARLDELRTAFPGV